MAISWLLIVVLKAAARPAKTTRLLVTVPSFALDGACFIAGQKTKERI
jgi:hypothetical protein